jgi:hypothetical protein
VERDDRSYLWEKFYTIFFEDPKLWKLMQQYCREAIQGGWEHYSARTIFHRIRWHVQVETSDPEFKINDHWTPYFSRVFMWAYPEHGPTCWCGDKPAQQPWGVHKPQVNDGFFELREVSTHFVVEKRLFDLVRGNDPNDDNAEVPMKLFSLKKKTNEGCDASRCKETEVTELPGDLWLLKTVKLCQRHGELAIQYARAHPTTAEVIPASELGDVPAGTTKIVEAAKSEAEAVLGIARSYAVETHEELTQVGEWLREVKAKRNELERQEKEITGPINLALRKVRELFKPAKTFWADAELILKGKIGAAKLLEEKRNQDALKEAADAHAAGNTEGVVAATARVTTTGDLQGVTAFTKWTYVMEDAAKFMREAPDQFKMPNDRLLKEHCAHSTDRQPAPIPGVKFVPDVQVSARAAT